MRKILEIDEICICTVLTLLSVFISQFHSRARGICLVLLNSRERDKQILVGGGGGQKEFNVCWENWFEIYGVPFVPK